METNKKDLILVALCYDYIKQSNAVNPLSSLKNIWGDA